MSEFALEFPSRGIRIACAFAVLALAGCMDAGMPLEPPSHEIPETILPGELTATISGDWSVTFKGGGIYHFSPQGFRLRSNGTGHTPGYFIEFRDIDRLEGIEPGVYPIVEAWSYFDPGFTVTLTRPLTSGREQYAAIEGELEITQVEPGRILGTFQFEAAQTWACVYVEQGTECDPVSGADRRQIVASGEFEAVR